MRIGRRSLLGGGFGLLALPAARAAGFTAIAQYESTTGGHVGFYAENIATGARLAWRADARFVMCSTFKASLAALVLSWVDRGQEGLDRLIPYTAADVQDWWAPVARANLGRGALSVGDMCKATVETSDNTCADLLLARVGGPTAMTRFWRACGDDVSRLDDSEPLLNRVPLGDDRDTTTPRAMAGNFQKFVLGHVLSDASRLLLKQWLIGSVTGADRLRAGLPKDWVVGDKTGHNGRDATGDVVIAWPDPAKPLVMCAYTRGGTPTERQFDAVFAGLGRMAASQLT